MYSAKSLSDYCLKVFESDLNVANVPAVNLIRRHLQVWFTIVNDVNEGK